MRIQLLLFASYADAFGTSELEMSVPEGASVSDVIARLGALAKGKALPPRPLVAINQSYAADSDVIHAGDEVALIPPVAGG